MLNFSINTASLLLFSKFSGILFEGRLLNVCFVEQTSLEKEDVSRKSLDASIVAGTLLLNGDT